MLLDYTNKTLVVIQWGVVIGTSLFAAFFDLWQRRIPNALTFPLLIIGLVFVTFFGGLTGLAEGIGACAVLALPYVLLFILVGGGAGDAKLMGVIGVWLGLKHGLFALVCIIIAGGGMAVAKAIYKKKLKFVLTSVFVSVYTLLIFLVGKRTVQTTSNGADIQSHNDLDLPYGVAIFAGVCAAALMIRMWGVEWIW